MAGLLGAIRQGYDAWQLRPLQEPGPRDQRQPEIDRAVRDKFHACDDVYGFPRITRELTRKGVVVDRKTVAAPMRR